MNPSEEIISRQQGVQSIRYWPVTKEKETFASFFVAEMKFEETGHCVFFKGTDIVEVRLKILNSFDPPLDGHPVPPTQLRSCPDDEPRVMKFDVWDDVPHANDPQQRRKHARRVELTSGTCVTVHGLLSAQDAKAAITGWLTMNRDRCKYVDTIIIEHKYTPENYDPSKGLSEL